MSEQAEAVKGRGCKGVNGSTGVVENWNKKERKIARLNGGNVE